MSGVQRSDRVWVRAPRARVNYSITITSRGRAIYRGQPTINLPSPTTHSRESANTYERAHTRQLIMTHYGSKKPIEGEKLRFYIYMFVKQLTVYASYVIYYCVFVFNGIQTHDLCAADTMLYHVITVKYSSKVWYIYILRDTCLTKTADLDIT